MLYLKYILDFSIFILYFKSSCENVYQRQPCCSFRQELTDIILGQAAQIDKLSNIITEHSMQLEWMKRQLFGAKSERFVEPDDLQTALELGVVTNDAPEMETTTVTYDRKKVPAQKNR